MTIIFNGSLGRAQVIARLTPMVGERLRVVEDAAAAVAAMPEADVLICPDTFYLEPVANAAKIAPKLRYVQLLTAGYDRVERFGKPMHATLCNAGDAYAPAVATHALALLLALQRQIPAVLADQPKRIWDRAFAPAARIPLGSTTLVVGLGPIGQEIARLLKAFGAHVIGVNHSGGTVAGVDETQPIANLSALLPRVDCVILALPLTTASRHLFGAAEFALCKNTALLVNIARGAITDQVALCEALKSKQIAGAAVDVTEPEPLPPEHPLWGAPNLILAPHFAGACGPLAGDRLAELVGDNLARFLKGEALRHVVNL